MLTGRCYAQRFKQRTLRITTTLNVNNSELLRDLFSKDALKIRTFTLDKADDEYIFQLKFDSMDMPTINDIIHELKKDPAIKEVFRSP